MPAVKTVKMTSVILLIVTTALSGCTGALQPTASPVTPPTLSPTTVAEPATPRPGTESPGPTTSPAANQTPSATPTTPAETVPSGCANLQLPALVLVPPPGREADPRRFLLVGPEGEEFCSLGAPYVPWASNECQIVGKRVRCWDESMNGLQVLDVVSGEVQYVEPELGREAAHPHFLVSPDGKQIAWSTTDTDTSDTDVSEGGSRCRVSVSQADGSDVRTVVEETYEKPYHLMPVTWTPAGDAIFFARMRVWVESGDAFIPAFAGRYSELFRLDLVSREFRRVFPVDEETPCNRCIGDVSSDGQWLATHRQDGSLILRDLVSGEETLIAGVSATCYLGHARLSPNGHRLVDVEMEGACDERDTFDLARTVMVDVPSEGESDVLAESTEAVDWPVGWLDDGTPIFDRVYKGFDHRGHWVVGHSAAPEDLLPGILIGVVRPSPTAPEGETAPPEGWVAFKTPEEQLPLISPDGARQITMTEQAEVGSFAWSPDGRSLAFAQDGQLMLSPSRMLVSSRSHRRASSALRSLPGPRIAAIWRTSTAWRREAARWRRTPCASSMSPPRKLLRSASRRTLGRRRWPCYVLNLSPSPCCR